MSIARLLTGVLLAFALTQPVAFAQEGPTIETRDTDGQPATDLAIGQEFVVVGSDFPALETVDVTFTQQDTPSDLGAFTVAEDGSFRADVQVPDDATAGAATVEATSGASSASQDVQVTEEAPAAPTATATSTATQAPGGPVATPGQTEDPLVGEDDDDDGGLVDSFLDFWPFILGVIVLVGGGVFLGIRWRQRQEAASGFDDVPSLDELDWDDGDEDGGVEDDDDGPPTMFFEPDDDSDLVVQPPTRGAGLTDDPSPPRMPSPPPDESADPGAPTEGPLAKRRDPSGSAPPSRPGAPPNEPATSAPPSRPEPPGESTEERPASPARQEQRAERERDPSDADADEFAVTEDTASDAIAKLRRDVTNWRRKKGD